MCKLWVVDISNQFALGLHVVNFWNWKPTLTTSCMRVRSSKRETGDWTMFPLMDLVGGMSWRLPPLLEICNETRQKQMKRKEKKREINNIYLFSFSFLCLYTLITWINTKYSKFSLQLPYENFLDPRMVSLFITIPFLNIKKNKHIRFQSVILCNVQNCWKTRNTIFVTKSGKKKHYHKKTEINSSLLTSPSHSIREIGYAAMTLGFF